MPSNRGELGTSDGTGLALERDLFGVRPRPARGDPLGEGLELSSRQKRGRAPAEVDEVERPPRKSRLARRTAPTPGPADRDTAPLPWRSCRCTPGSSRNDSAYGRKGCAGTAPAACRTAPATPAQPWRPWRRRRGSRRKMAGNSRQSSCRPRSARGRPPATGRTCLYYTEPGPADRLLGSVGSGSGLIRLIRLKEDQVQDLSRTTQELVKLLNL